MSRIALNGRFTCVAQPTGTQIVALHLFDAILRRNRDFDFVFFGDARCAGVAEWRDLPRVTIVDVPLQDRSRNYAQLWEQFALPGLCRQHGCEFVHHPITTSPMWPRGLRSIVTLHDLNFYLHPEWYGRAFRWAYRFFALPGIQKAERVVTISNYVQKQAAEHFHIGPDRLRMIYNGVKPMVADRTRLDSGKLLYILCVGSLPPHKNLPRMIEAFQLVRAENPGLELHLVGRPHPRMGQGDPRLPELLASPGVRALGYLSEADLGLAYAGAAVFCYPSLEEGFGLPLLEAMSVGTLVLTSNTSCLPEVAGPAATLVDPYSVEAIANGLREILALSAEARASRSEGGREWSARFSWAASADEYLKLYRELA